MTTLNGAEESSGADEPRMTPQQPDTFSDIACTPVHAHAVPEGSHQMQCMEVWGGNQAISTAVAMRGLTAWVCARPHGSDGRQDVPGGDIHYLTSCATGRITRLVVADVAGHGPIVARAADSLRALMRKYSNFYDQSAFVESLNRRFAELAEQEDDDSVAPGAFATAVVATYIAPTDQLVISSAGHPRPMWYHARTGEWSVLMARADHEGLSNLPLGVDRPTTYPTTKFSLGAGDLVLFYSDSLIESRDAQRLMLGEQGLRELLCTIDARRPDTMVDELLKRLAARSGSDELGDDVTVMLITPNADKPRASIVASFVAAGRLISHAARSLLPGGMPMARPELGIESIGGAMIERLNRFKTRRGGSTRA